MTLTERRNAIKAQLEKAKRQHRSTRALQREYEILTAGIMAEKRLAEKAKSKMELEAFQPCHLARPDLWEAFCRLQGRPNEPSEHWTTFDVVMILTRKLLEASQTGLGPSQLPN
jgi:hypothetical protein